ncbi:SH3 domain-containing protein [Sphingomonas kaistensis]|uniref:SH3 domain-containing protein n=1 Tax=Sphingomonas kaistensis TaxID=298708 RepID=A0ABZ2G3F5_9SPHN
MADIALAGTVIASHYVEPLQCHLKHGATLRASPSETGDALGELEPGASVRILDKRSGWAWGYAGGLVGYVPAAALTA